MMNNNCRKGILTTYRTAKTQITGPAKHAKTTRRHVFLVVVAAQRRAAQRRAAQRRAAQRRAAQRRVAAAGGGGPRCAAAGRAAAESTAADHAAGAKLTTQVAGPASSQPSQLQQNSFSTILSTTNNYD